MLLLILNSDKLISFKIKIAKPSVYPLLNFSVFCSGGVYNFRVALGYSSSTGTWTEDTKAAVSLGVNSVEGEKSLRFDAWENGVGYKFAKIYEDAPFNQSANALKFRLMVPSMNTVKVLVHTQPVEILGTYYSPSFTYTLDVQSGEYVEYTIPLADDGWALWGEAGKSMHTVADWLGVHEDDMVRILKKVEFYVQGYDGKNGLPYIGFLDSASFVTLDNPALSQDENMKEYKVYTGNTASGNVMKLELGDEGAVATIIDVETPTPINGQVTVDGKSFTFVSNDGETLTYNGRLINGGQSIRFVSAEGSLAAEVEDMDFGAVQVLDNFEQYETDGQAYYASNPDKNNRSGCRGAYYSEYYKGSGSTEWGGSGWSLLEGYGDQLKLKQDQAGAHSGNNYLCLKNSTGVGMRYMQWGLFDGSSQKNSYRGAKLGFWAKTKGLVKQFKFTAYSQTTPRNATKDSYMKQLVENRTEAFTEWEHFEIELNPDVVYYGFLVFMEKSYLDEATYLYIDDVEIYTANPYATYSA